MKSRLMCVVCAAAGHAASGHEFYSVAVDGPEHVLVRVHSDTAQVEVIGSLGSSFHQNVQMTVYEGRLLAIVRGGIFSNCRLVELDPETGVIMSMEPTTFNGNNVCGESLAVVDGQLLMSFDPGADAFSERVGILSLDGTIEQIANFTGAIDDDIDGLEQCMTTGTVYNLDHDGSGNTDLYEVDLAAEQQARLCNWAPPGLDTQDPVCIDGVLHSIGLPMGGPARFLWLDPLTCEVDQIFLDTDMELRGLALARLSCPADCNKDGTLDILDFVCFVALFQAGDPAADCNDDGAFTILDFICFQALFMEGCP